jgi:hypothetical protein
MATLVALQPLARRELGRKDNEERIRWEFGARRRFPEATGYAVRKQFRYCVNNAFRPPIGCEFSEAGDPTAGQSALTNEWERSLVVNAQFTAVKNFPHHFLTFP